MRREAKKMSAIVEAFMYAPTLVSSIIRSSNKAGSIEIIGNIHSNLCQTHIFVALDKINKITIVLGDI